MRIKLACPKLPLEPHVAFPNIEPTTQKSLIKLLKETTRLTTILSTTTTTITTTTTTTTTTQKEAPQTGMTTTNSNDYISTVVELFGKFFQKP